MKAKKVKEIDNPIYFGINYSNSLESKRLLLSSEISFLNIIKIARRYDILRREEFEIKNRIYKAVKELGAALRKTRTSFPFLKIPQNIKREELKKNNTIKKSIDEDLEGELKRIQERLKSLQ